MTRSILKTKPYCPYLNFIRKVEKGTYPTGNILSEECPPSPCTLTGLYLTRLITSVGEEFLWERSKKEVPNFCKSLRATCSIRAKRAGPCFLSGAGLAHFHLAKQTVARLRQLEGILPNREDQSLLLGEIQLTAHRVLCAVCARTKSESALKPGPLC